MFKIYKIVDNTNGDVYIGRTKQKLKRRLANHRSPNNTCISREIIENGDYEIMLIEETDDKTRERYYIENTECINRVIPGRTQEEWHKENKERKRAKEKAWWQENREKENEKQRQRYAENREEYNEKARQRYAENIERERERNNAKMRALRAIPENREREKERARQRYAEKKLMRNQLQMCHA